MENRPLPSGRRRAMSISCRLITGYTIVVVITLAVAAVYLHGGLKKMFAYEDAERLSDSVLSVRMAVKHDPAGLSEAQQLIVSLAGEREVEKYYGRLIDDKGHVLMETPGMEKVSPPPGRYPAPVGLKDQVTSVKETHSPAGVPVFIAAALVERAPGQPPLTYHVVLDIEHVEELMGKYRRRLLITVSSAALITALLGWFITRRSLRPISDIAATAQRVTASGLNEHVSGGKWPRELASLAAEFDGMLLRLRGSFDRLTQFTADAAHEFRTPLNNLMGATSLALARPRSTEEYRALLEGNIEEYQRLNSMMERLLFLARADEGRSAVNRQPQQAEAVMHSIADFFLALAEERGVTLTCTGDAIIHADPVMLRMALTNLVSNALRHTPQGGSVEVHAEARPQATVITVKDTGDGIPPEHLPRLFDRFYRVDASRTSPIGGAGLGLAIVHAILKLHGGSITAESVPGEGCAFRMTFPNT
jgi:two-component system, OmpR family, heavy metal sensor histidine kinase CusS